MLMTNARCVAMLYENIEANTEKKLSEGAHINKRWNN